jgi:Zn-dependent M16 (insulinase) family peptidase
VVPVELLALVPLFCRCLTEMGTTARNDIVLSEYIRTHTGGIYTSTTTTNKYGKANTIHFTCFISTSVQMLRSEEPRAPRYGKANTIPKEAHADAC